MKQKNWFFIISAILLSSTLIIMIITYLLYPPKNYTKELNNMGYTTDTEEEAFYKKIITNNTLEEYYNDVSNERDSKYEEYYFAKDSYDYIELKMSYQQYLTTTLTITSNLKNLHTTFNYEISKGDSYLLLEGTNSPEFVCNQITNKDADDELVNNYCNEVKDEINSYLIRRDKLLENKEIKEIINKK